MSARALMSLMALALVAAIGCCGTKSPPPAQPASGAAPTAAAAAATATPAPAAAARPTTAEGCKACNGDWGQHGIAPEPSCNCRTSDGGKKCRDGNECQGMCIAAETPERDVLEAGPHPRGYFVGRCSDVATVYGCNRIIERGAAARGPVVLDEPPQAICAD